MNAARQSGEDLAKRLAEAEEVIVALRSGEGDAITANREALLLRLAPVELALKEARDNLDSSAKSQTEEALRESERRFRTLVEQAADAFFLCTLDGEILDVNQQACASLGYTRDELLSMTIADIDVKVEPDGHKERFWDKVVPGKPITIDGRQRRKDGTMFPVEVRIDLLELGGQRYMTGLARDITERRRAERERMAHLQFLESMERVDRALRGTVDLDQMMGDVLEATRSVFDCDRAWLLYPCDPDAPSWRVPMERNRPEYPGAFELNAEVPMDRGVAGALRRVLASDGPVRFGPGCEHPLPSESARQFDFQSQIAMAIHPKLGPSWVFGLHQCSYPRVWTEEEDRLLRTVGRRIADALSTVLTLRDLRGSQERYRALVDNADLGIALINSDFEVLMSNPTQGRIMNTDHRSFVGRKCYAAFEMRDAICPHCPGRRAMETGRTHEAETEGVRDDGTRISVRVQAFPVFASDGSVDGFVEFVDDITERKEAENALRESEQRFRTLIEQAADAVFLNTTGGKILDVNQRACESLGYTREELLSMTLADIDIEIESHRHRERFWDKLVPEQRITFEGRHRHKDGTTFPVEVSVGLIELEGQRVMLGLARDISERRQAEQEREKLEAQLRQSQKMEAVGQLAGGVAHDFNNILTGILGYIELAAHELDAGPAPNPSLSDALHQVRLGAQRAAQLTRQLLAFSRRQVSQPRVLNLNDTLTEMEKMLSRLIAENIALGFMRAPDLHSVLVDPGWVEQVIMNLVVNACDAMPGGGRLMLKTSNVALDDEYAASHPEVPPGDYALLTVSDTGIGMDAATIQRVFEPFFTTKAMGHGTGLGLATVYGIVRQSGGHISAHSEPGRGTTFRVYLPAAGEPADQATVAANEPPPTGSETVLLCEDHEPVRRLAGRVLRAAGYTVLPAHSGEHALEIEAEYAGPIDVLVTDVVMPDMHGKALADQLALRRPEVAALYMSGYTADVIADHGVLDEGVEFLGKPFTPQSLLERVRQVLDQRETAP